MEDQFVPYELALKLKELGFNESCIKFWKQNDAKKVIQETWIEHPEWESSDILPDFRLVDLQSSNKKYLDIKDGECSAPLWQQAFNWFKIKHNLYSTILPFQDIEDGVSLCWYYTIVDYTEQKNQNIRLNESDLNASDNFESYEECLNELMEHLIEMINH